MVLAFTLLATALVVGAIVVSLGGLVHALIRDLPTHWKLRLGAPACIVTGLWWWLEGGVQLTYGGHSSLGWAWAEYCAGVALAVIGTVSVFALEYRWHRDRRRKSGAACQS